MKARDLTNERFGLLVALEKGRNKHNQIVWICKCDCGNRKSVLPYDLVNGKTTSCGCRLISRNTKHGGYYTRMYTVWKGIKQRCFNENHKHFKHYGGRGITVCEEWLDFQSFCDWALVNGYNDSLSIDRIDVNGDYEPSNCRWATKLQQANNMRTNCFIEYNNKKQTIAEWSKETGVSKSVIRYRLNNGFSLDRVFNIKNSQQ